MSGSSGASEDLEDGEIFDDDEPVAVFKGGGVEEKPPQPESPPREPAFKNKSHLSAGGNDRKKPGKEKPRSSSNERRDNKRADRPNNRTSASKRKRGRESEEDHRAPNKSKQRKANEKNQVSLPVEEEVDESEMIYVMGGNSPPGSKSMEWDMFSGDEDEGDRDRENERGGGGRGRRGREGFHSSGRMSRRSRLSRGGGKRNRFSRKPNSDLAICKFYIQGKCQRVRGNDCPFSHTALPSKKMELCKFYMNDCCTKRDKCMYMHGDFPCKFYHTGQKCFAGKRCKFYHGKISNFLRSVLMKHLENRELQNEFDKYREQYEKKDRNRGRDRERFSDRRTSRSDEEEGGSTPMPSPQRDEFTSDRERSPTPEREREKRERRRRRKQRRSREEENRRDFRDEKEEYYNSDQGRDGNEYDQYNSWADQGLNQHANHFDDYANDGGFGMDNNYCNDGNYNDNTEFSQDDYAEPDNSDIPANLPKTQRKLFMRLQQQQQHKKKSDDRHMDKELREEEFKEENWYSSDEENANNCPLNTIYQNVPGLNQMQPVPLMNSPIQPPPPLLQQPMMNNQCQPMNQGPMPLMASMMQQPQPMVNMPKMFDNIDLSAVTKILTTVRESIQKKNSEPGGPMGGPGGPMGGPGGPMGGPSGPMGGPGGPMGGPSGPIRGPGGPMGGPGGPMGGPGGPMGGPGGPMGGPGGHMGGPIGGSSGHMGGHSGPMGGPGGPMGGPGGPMGGPGGPMGGPGGPLGGPNIPISRASEPSPSSSPQHNPSTHDDRRFRDPRLRGHDSGSSSDKKSITKPMVDAGVGAPVLLTQADLDLRLSEPSPQQHSQGSDVDLRHLPFKPAPHHQAATEIDASISSGPPVEYKLSVLKPLKPDYAAIASKSNPQTCANDPRLRKYSTPQVLAQSQMVVAQALPSGATRMISPPRNSPVSPPHSQFSTASQSCRPEEVIASRDPRNRGGVANDPRRRSQQSTPPTPAPPPSFPPGQPFGQPPFGAQPPFNNQPFGDQQLHQQDNDFRMGMLSQFSQPSNMAMLNSSDIDLRIQQSHYYQ